MKAIKTDPCNLTFTLEGCEDLPAAMGDGFVATYWQPDADELRALAEGLPVRVCLKGAVAPRPMMLDVEDPETGKIAGQGGGIKVVMRADPEELAKFLEGVHGAVEVDRYSSFMLWKENQERTQPLPWESSGQGIGDTAGHLAGFPVCVSLFTPVIAGKKILFVEPTSRVVDHDIVRAYLERVLPATARREDGRLRYDDANNFHNVLR